MTATGINKYSSTPSSNSSAAPNGAPEGMAPSGVNDTMRQMMAEIRRWYEDPTWIDYGYTYSYVGAAAFKVSGIDVTGNFVVGRRVRIIGTTTGTIYGTIATSVFSTDTNVTVTLDSGTVQSETLAVSVGLPSLGNPLNIQPTTNAQIIAAVLTAYASGVGTISSSDSILTAIQKLNGNFVAGSAPNNAVTVTSNAGTCSAAFKSNTFTNSSAATMAITLSTSGMLDDQPMIVRIYDYSAAVQTIGWTNTENSTVSVPTASNGSTTSPLTVGFLFNNATSKWRCVAAC